jgi:hypothetical protein
MSAKIRHIEAVFSTAGIPVFGDRDKIIHDNVNELSPKRRKGYKWSPLTRNTPLKRFEKWDQESREIKQ